MRKQDDSVRIAIVQCTWPTLSVKSDFLFKLKRRKIVTKSWCVKDLKKIFVCTTDRAVPDQLTIPLNKLPWVEQHN